MIREYIKHYIWFWKASFDFMQGTNKFKIACGCLTMAHRHAVDMVKWDRMTKAEKELVYINMDRTL